jgi:lysozyme
MTAALPAARPRVSRADLISAVHRAHPAHDFAGRLTVVGVRGYYRDTLGAVGRNDRAMYDDALFLVSDDAFVAFNGNTDPSGYRSGRGTGAGKGMASLNPGLWPVYRFDLHQGKYLALCQRAGVVTVTRDGTPPYPDTGMFGINIHKGGVNGTSSEGCQTVPAAQWPAFIATAQDQAKRAWGADWRTEVITYVLLEGPVS